MRVGYKENVVYLFLPQSDGAYGTYYAEAAKWNSSSLVSKETMFVLIDPPESPDYKREAVCHVIEYCSNDDDRHIKNAHKDDTVLLMGIPRIDEILCMSDTLYSEEFPIRVVDKETQKTIFSETLATDEQKKAALYRRCSLVGCIPGIVFNGDEFIKTLREVHLNAKRECSSSSFENLLAFYKGGAVGSHKSAVAAMSRFFGVRPFDKKRLIPLTSLNPATAFYIQEELRKKLASVTGSSAFQFEDISAMLLEGGRWGGKQFPPRTIVCGANLGHTANLILSSNDKTVVRASNCFPILDFATAPDVWFNAKVGESTPKLSLSAFVSVMHYLKFCAIENNELILRAPLQKKISLTVFPFN